MRKHLATLRQFYARVLVSERKADASVWPVSFVLDWLSYFQGPPLEKRTPVLPLDAVCPQCAGRRPAAPDEIDRTRLVFPGGCVIRCGHCGGQWVVLHEAVTVPNP